MRIAVALHCLWPLWSKLSLDFIIICNIRSSVVVQIALRQMPPSTFCPSAGCPICPRAECPQGTLYPRANCPLLVQNVPLSSRKQVNSWTLEIEPTEGHHNAWYNSITSVQCRCIDLYQLASFHRFSSHSTIAHSMCCYLLCSCCWSSSEGLASGFFYRDVPPWCHTYKICHRASSILLMAWQLNSGCASTDDGRPLKGNTNLIMDGSWQGHFKQGT